MISSPRARRNTLSTNKNRMGGRLCALDPCPSAAATRNRKEDGDRVTTTRRFNAALLPPFETIPKVPAKPGASSAQMKGGRTDEPEHDFPLHLMASGSLRRLFGRLGYAALDCAGAADVASACKVLLTHRSRRSSGPKAAAQACINAPTR